MYAINFFLVLYDPVIIQVDSDPSSRCINCWKTFSFFSLFRDIPRIPDSTHGQLESSKYNLFQEKMLFHNANSSGQMKYFIFNINQKIKHFHYQIYYYIQMINLVLFISCHCGKMYKILQYFRISLYKLCYLNYYVVLDSSDEVQDNTILCLFSCTSFYICVKTSEFENYDIW